MLRYCVAVYMDDMCFSSLCFKATATTEIYTYCHTLSLHDALPIVLVVRHLLRRRRHFLCIDCIVGARERGLLGVEPRGIRALLGRCAVGRRLFGGGRGRRCGFGGREIGRAHV